MLCDGASEANTPPNEIDKVCDLLRSWVHMQRFEQRSARRFSFVIVIP
jgi:hypothetical protein